ncbi:MAG: sugar transferase [Candidatus Aquicultorales bacterium]
MAEIDRKNTRRLDKRDKRRGTLLVPIDAGAVFVSFALALYLRFETALIPRRFPLPDIRHYFELMLVMVVIWIGVFAFFGLYTRRNLFVGTEEYRRVIHAGLTGTFLTALVIFLAKEEVSRGWVVLACVLATVGSLVMRFVFRRLRRVFINRTGFASPVLMIGTNEEAIQVAESIAKDFDFGFRVAGFLGEGRYATGAPVLGRLEELQETVARNHIESAVVVPSAVESREIPGVLKTLGGLNVDTYVSPSLTDILASRARVQPLGGVPLIALHSVEFSGISFLTKRAIDLAGAAAICVALSPLLAGIAVMIKLDSPGPVLFRQERGGRDGKLFRIYKFRTMVADAETRLQGLAELNEADGPLFKMKNDPRITRVGSVLRRFSLDELPQLFNVLKGEMSLVGPRPALPDEIREYSERHMQRLKTLPGMTGYWQVNGRSETSFEEMVKMDIYYIENWSPLFDFYILARTVPAVFKARGAY